MAALALAPALGVRAAVTAAPAHTTVHVTIQHFAFSPQTLTVAPGATVVWTNKDSAAHTVTSDTSAWTPSGTIAQGHSFSVTFSKPATYPYHRAIHPNMTAKAVVSSGSASGGHMGGAGMMDSMGPMSRTSIPSFTGWYDKHKVLFLATDTSSKTEAMSEHISDAASLAKSLHSADQIYMVTNGAFAKNGAVFGSQPGEKDYTPLWQEVLVKWTDPDKAAFLGSDNDIKAAAKAGKVTLTMTGTVLNCPIIKVMGGS